MAIYRGDGGAGDATNDVTVNQVADYVSDALTSKNAAATSATNAATSATNAATSASNAATSESNAATSATSAATSATNAGISETNASASATAAAASAASAASSDYAVSSWFSTTNNSTNWNTAYGWGNHALAGYLTSETFTGTVTSVAATFPAGFAVTGSPITTTGTLAIAFDTGYSLPTTASQTNWDTAYGWGDHALAGYALTSSIGTTIQAYDATLETGATKTSRKNAIINGNFDVWQRGTSSTTNNGYGSADRWRQFLDSATGSTSRQAFTLGQTDVPNNPTYFMRFACTTAPPTAALLTERIEDVTTFAGETITVSFYAKSVTPTNISSIVLRQAFGTGGSPSSVVDTVVQSSVVLTTSWQRFEYQVAVPGVSGKTLGTNDDDHLELRFSSGNATFSWDIAQVQVEKGSAATDFERRTPTEELVLCQRYFWKSFPQSVTPAQNYGIDSSICMVGTSTGSGHLDLPFPVVMRTTPTVVTFNPAASNSSFRNNNDGTDSVVNISSVTSERLLSAATNLSASNANDYLFVHATADAEL